MVRFTFLHKTHILFTNRGCVASFWMVFCEYKTELFYCLYISEGTEVVVNLVSDDFWVSEDELTGALSDKIESWY